MAEIKKEECKYPIHIGPLFMCCYCKTMFISEEFLDKHQKKCIHIKLHLILKTKLELKRNTIVEVTESPTTSIDQNETLGDYYCEECFCGFVELSEYERHKRDQHAADQPLQCNRQFISHRICQRHTAMTHPYQSNCNLSSESLKKKSEITIDNHSNSKKKKRIHWTKMLHLNRGRKLSIYPRVCEFCSKTYRASSSFYRHRILSCPKYTEFLNSYYENEKVN